MHVLDLEETKELPGPLRGKWINTFLPKECSGKHPMFISLRIFGIKANSCVSPTKTNVVDTQNYVIDKVV
jgi:hypothetical protein